MELSIAHGFFCFLVYVAAICVVLRVYKNVEPAQAALVTAIIVFFVTATALLIAGGPINVLGFIISYGFFVLCFLMAFGALYKSISLRIMSDLSKTPSKTEVYDQVVARYIAAESYQSRLAVILKNGLAVRMKDRLALTPRGRSIALCIRSVQKAFGIQNSG